MRNEHGCSLALYTRRTMPRHREFNTDQALESAMHAFWKHGYEATSLTDLMEAMGLQKGSIYKAFSDKHSLFIATLKRYLDEAHRFDTTTIDKAISPKESISLWLKNGMKNICGQSLKRGCLIVNVLTERGSQDEEVSNLVKEHYAETLKLLTKTIEEGQVKNEFRKDLIASEQAQLILVSLIGMLVLTKGPISESESLQNIKNVMKLIER
ncbi:MAG: TetR/AcrR family transcriptional regulator [Gammaproteobacteria bacterium]